MNDGLLAKTYFLAGRVTRISRNTVMAIARGPVRVATWTNRRLVWSARLLNPFSWRRRTRQERPRSRKSSPAGTARNGLARQAPPPSVGRAAAPPARKGLSAGTARLPSVGADEVAGAGEQALLEKSAPGVEGPGPAEAPAVASIGAVERAILSKAQKDLSRSDRSVRARAARALGGIRRESSVRGLSAHLAREPSAIVRKECVNALAALEMEKGLPAVERALSDTAASVRFAAVRGVYRLGGLKSAGSLVRMLSDKYEDVRRRAASCIGWLGQEHLAVHLLPLLKDTSAFVRRTVLDALGNLKSPRAVDDAVELLDDPEESVRKKAFDVLRAITGEQMVETFPEDEDGRQLLLARWRVWQEGDAGLPAYMV